MRKAFVAVAALALALPLAALAQDTKPMEEKAGQKPMMEAKPAGGVRADILRQIEDAEKKLLALAEAMPAEKYGWRPGEGVRSVGEVFAHTAAANYFLPTLVGVKMPEGVNPREFEKSGGDKAKTSETLKASFEHARKAVQSLADADLDTAVKIFGQDGTYRAALLLLATHAHEHLGQSIAYARMNGVTPPWSAGGQ
jgi:uncharacterized damage-inducible protein DinB